MRLVALVRDGDLAAGAERRVGRIEDGVGGTRTREVPDADSAASLLEAELAAGDVVLFKSSRDAGLRLLGDRLAGPREELT